MEDFITLRKVTHSLARWYALSSIDPDLQARSKSIDETLSNDFKHWVPGDAREITPQIEDEFFLWRKAWSNITLTDARLAQIEAQLEAAWAMTIAHSVVIAEFRSTDAANILDVLFHQDMNWEREQDARKHAYCQERLDVCERWPLYAIMSTMAFCIAIADTISSFDGQASAILGVGGIGGFVAAYFLRREERSMIDLKIDIESKWYGRPDRFIPFLENEKFRGSARI